MSFDNVTSFKNNNKKTNLRDFSNRFFSFFFGQLNRFVGDHKFATRPVDPCSNDIDPGDSDKHLREFQPREFSSRREIPHVYGLVPSHTHTHTRRK